MADLHLCVPVLKRYDLLKNLLLSLEYSTVQPHTVHVVDNGRDRERMIAALVVLPKTIQTDIMMPDEPMGLAESWNWFIENVPEERLITNDDVTFADDSLEKMMVAPGSFVSALAGTNACSCFLLRDECVKVVGLFDEDISPGYAYFEDCDYVERMLIHHLRITAVECGVMHLGSQTIAANSPEEWRRHDARFQIAQSNFVKKWGRLPDLGAERIVQ